MVGFILTRPIATKPLMLTMPCRYQSLVVSVPCMVFDSIMNQNTHVIGFYIGYFGHMTKYACMLHRYLHGFVFAMIDKAFFMINGAFHHMALFTIHINICAFCLQPIRFFKFHNISTRYMAIRKVFFSLLEESLSIVIKTSNWQHPSVVSTPIHVLLYSSML